MSMALSKHVTRYGLPSGFPYCSNPPFRYPIFTTRGCSEKPCGFGPWESSPVSSNNIWDPKQCFGKNREILKKDTNSHKNTEQNKAFIKEDRSIEKMRPNSFVQLFIVTVMFYDYKTETNYLSMQVLWTVIPSYSDGDRVVEELAKFVILSLETVDYIVA